MKTIKEQVLEEFDRNPNWIVAKVNLGKIADFTQKLTAKQKDKEFLTILWDEADSFSHIDKVYLNSFCLNVERRLKKDEVKE